MKKFVKSFLLAASALLLFAGCSNLSDGTVSGSNDEGKGVITIGIEGASGRTARSARTINPEEYTQTTAFTKITLKGESESYDSFDEVTLTFGADGTAKKELSYDVWYLTLTAYMGDVPVLQGLRRVDMKNNPPAAGEAITFALSAEGVTSVGGVDLSGTITDTAGNAATWEAALYDLYTNEVVLDNTGATTASSGDCSAAFAYTATNVKPGRYNFRIYFKNSAGQRIGTWGDIVVIAPGRTTTATKDLGDILMKAPSAPTALSAYYMAGSVTGNYYNALITWTRAALHNEEYFELTINDITAASPDPYKIFTNENVATANKEVFFESASRVDGTLAAGSEYCIVKLPVGKRFDISIKAVNFIGASAAKDRDEATAASAIELSSGETVGDNTPYGADSINLMKIAYDLSGGSLKKSATGGAITGTYNDYVIYEGSAITLLAPSASGYPQLTEGHHPFLGWKDSTNTIITSISDFGNTSVTASFNTEAIINYTVDDSYGTLENVTATTSNGSVINGTVTNSDGTITFAVGDTGVTHIKVTFLSNNGDDVTVEAASSSVVFNKINKLKNGTTYEVQIIATIPDANGVEKLYSYVCAITKNN